MGTVLSGLLLGFAAASAAEDAVGGRVTVLAAASLTEAFRAAGDAFQAAHPGVEVQFNFAGSSTLARQIEQGAPADVFASAGEADMKRVADGGLVAGAPAVFAQNRLAIVVEAGNPKHVTGLADLARPGLVVVLCGPTVPAGRFAVEAFGKAGVPVPEGSREADVKAVVAKVSLGEADAGIAYVTDVRAAGGKVAAVDIPEGQNVVARYPIAVLRDAANAPSARAFVASVQSAAGQQLLGRFGFLPE